MLVFIDFWKLETENSLLHVFSFLHKLSFENSFCFLPVLSCQTSFLVSKIENCFWKLKIRGKNSYQTYPKNHVISKSIHVTRNRHVWHANLFVSTRNNSFNITHFTCITNKYLFYFRFVKYLLYPTYILNLRRRVSNYNSKKINSKE